MISVDLVNPNLFIAFWLIFTRSVSICFQLPIFDNLGIPSSVKVLTSLIISYAFFDKLSVPVLQDIQLVGEQSFIWLTIFNVCIGLVIGYILKSIMSIFLAAGHVITQQIGFGAINYFDPSQGTQVGPFEQLIRWTVLVIILLSGALVPMFKGLYLSFFSVHLHNLTMISQSPVFFLDFFKGLFISSLLLSTPIIFINLMVMTVLGIVARFVPQMNILMVSFVVNIGLGLLVFISSSSEFFHMAFKIYTDKLGAWFQFIT